MNKLNQRNLSQSVKNYFKKLKTLEIMAHIQILHCSIVMERKMKTTKRTFAKLSLEFLDRYFSDQYEIDSLY